MSSFKIDFSFIDSCTLNLRSNKSCSSATASLINSSIVWYSGAVAAAMVTVTSRASELQCKFELIAQVTHFAKLIKGYRYPSGGIITQSFDLAFQQHLSLRKPYSTPFHNNDYRICPLFDMIGVYSCKSFNALQLYFNFIFSFETYEILTSAPRFTFRLKKASWTSFFSFLKWTTEFSSSYIFILSRILS